MAPKTVPQVQVVEEDHEGVKVLVERNVQVPFFWVGSPPREELGLPPPAPPPLTAQERVDWAAEYRARRAARERERCAMAAEDARGLR